MIYKLVQVKYDEFVPPAGVDFTDDYNQMPGPYWEVSQDEYLHFADIYSPKYREFRQVKWDVTPYFVTSIRIEWYHDRGYAILNPSKWHTRRDSDPKPLYGEPYNLVWDEPIRYFRIGCEHEYKELTAKQCEEYGINDQPRMHWHITRCDKCGTVESYDSSG